MKKILCQYMTIQEIRETIDKKEKMPISIYSASKKRVFIAKTRGSIFGKQRKKKI